MKNPPLKTLIKLMAQ